MTFLKSGKADIKLFGSVTSGGALYVLNFYTMFLNFFFFKLLIFTMGPSRCAFGVMMSPDDADEDL